MKDYNRKRATPSCLLMVDLRKAYDSVSWDFLRHLLLQVGFPPIFVGWVMACVTSTSFSIAINGEKHGFFVRKRGLRQGDPISPYLFTLCMEYFSRLMEARTSAAGFEYHSRCQQSRLNHLAYADDLVIFCKARESSVRTILEVLDEFVGVSGLRVNQQKSDVFFTGVDPLEKQRSVQILGMREGQMPVRYLGIPLNASKLRVIHYTPLLDQVRAVIASWKTKSLSYVGKLELLKTGVQGILGFWFDMLFVPMGIIDEVVAICRKFLWNSKKPPIAWTEICKPKEEGGAGLRDWRAWNRAILLRHIHYLTSGHDSLWCDWIRDKYLNGISFEAFQPKKETSYFLRQLCTLRDQIHYGQNAHTITEALGLVVHEGVFSVKLAYGLIRPPGEKLRDAPIIWYGKTTARHAFMLWMAYRRKLLTRDRISLEDGDSVCPFLYKGSGDLWASIFSMRFHIPGRSLGHEVVGI